MQSQDPRARPPLSQQSQLADLADVILELSHHLDPRAPEVRDVIALTGTEIALMRVVHRHPGISPSQLARQAGLRPSNVSTTLRSLEGRGLVERVRPAGDGRAVELLPTPLAAQSVARLRGFWADQLQHAPDEALADALAAGDSLRRIAEALADGER